MDVGYPQDTCDQMQHAALHYQSKETISLDTISSFASKCSVKQIDQSLCFLNNRTGGIYQHDPNVSSITLKYSINISDGVPNDFWISNDHVYLLYAQPNQLIRIDSEGNQEIIFSQNQGLFLQTFPFMGDKLQIAPFGNLVSTAFSQHDEQYNVKPFKLLNINGTTEYGFGQQPEILRKYQFPLIGRPSRIHHDQQHIIAYGFSPSIEVYHRDSFLNHYCAKSMYLDPVISGLGHNASFQERSNYIIEKGFYLGIYYNVTEGRYYRIVKHPQPLKSAGRRLNKRYDGTWSVIVLDDSFQTIGECIMPANQYDYFACFTNDQAGLWVANKSDSLQFENLQFY